MPSAFRRLLDLSCGFEVAVSNTDKSREWPSLSCGMFFDETSIHGLFHVAV